MRYEAEDWNDQFRPGTEVLLTGDDGRTEITWTRSEAWRMGDGTSVVLVIGRTGGYMLSRIRPAKWSTRGPAQPSAPTGRRM